MRFKVEKGNFMEIKKRMFDKQIFAKLCRDSEMQKEILANRL